MTTDATTVEAALVDADAAAAMCGIHRATWYKAVSNGKAPASVRIGGVVRWRRTELEEWIAAGCPARQKWESMRAPATKNRRRA